jgi:hypothetical protein
LIELLVVRWGFAAMVAVAIVAGFATALTVAVPNEIPSFALGATPVYRVEVGAAVFFGLYLTTMALVLAMHNRGFTELGTGGFRAQDLASLRGPELDEFVLESVEEIREQMARREECENVDRETLGHSCGSAGPPRTN